MLNFQHMCLAFLWRAAIILPCAENSAFKSETGGNRVMAKRRAKEKDAAALSRRERQFLDVVYAHREATAKKVMEQLPDPPSYSAVRATLALLEKKGHLKHRREGVTYIYSPVVAPTRARASALRHLMRTFFDGSPTETVATLLEQEWRWRKPIGILEPGQRPHLSKELRDVKSLRTCVSRCCWSTPRPLKLILAFSIKC